MNSNHREVTYIRITLSRFADWSIDNVYWQVKDLNPLNDVCCLPESISGDLKLV